ncbi:MAG: hypothetical protein C5B56_06455 [Proteobacteria bacterium]|nr:MAG: hypothetical protein C5B56_06455 [Pseudomonadota bacterium]
MDRCCTLPYASIVACQHTYGLAPLDAMSAPAPTVPAEPVKMVRALLFAVPMSAALWAGIIFLVLRLRAAL